MHERCSPSLRTAALVCHALSPVSWSGSRPALREDSDDCEGGELDERIFSPATGPSLVLPTDIAAGQARWASGDRTRNLQIKSTVIRFAGFPACSDTAASSSSRARFARFAANSSADPLAAVESWAGPAAMADCPRPRQCSRRAVRGTTRCSRRTGHPVPLSAAFASEKAGGPR